MLARHVHVIARIVEREVDLRVFVTLTIDSGKLRRRPVHRRLDLDAVDVFNLLDGCHCADGHSGPVSDHQRVLWVRVVEAGEPAHGQLGDHVIAIGRIDFSVRTKSHVVLTLPNRNRGIVAFLEIDDVRIFIMLADRQLRPNLKGLRVHQDTPVHRVGFPKYAAAHGDGGHEQENNCDRLRQASRFHLRQ